MRHGQPDWAPDGRATNDPALTAMGQEQANRVAHRLASVRGMERVWVSSMLRARQTSEPVGAELRVEAEVCDWLQEINLPPEWEGEPVEEVERTLAQADLRSMDEMWDGLPRGESFRAFHGRVVAGITKMLAAHGVHPMEPGHRHLWTVEDPDQKAVIVAHAGTNAVILGYLLGLDPVPWEWERFRQPHTGVSRLTMVRISTGWTFSLRQLGNVEHLHPAMITG